MQAPDPHAVRIHDKASADAFVAGLMATMRDLDAVLASESDGVRIGRIREAMVDAPRKAELASAYLNGLEAAKANAIALTRFAPTGIEALKAAHRRFTAVVETNQAVLATARTVSEGLIRTLADELGNASTSAVYGRPSSPPSPYGRNAGRAPLVFSRSL
ncbi:hypothetical protein [Methylobacterium haplocladii]|uniref:Flagellar protein FlgN n=1 Tax=Methylobacterium haplocladii TaxID=1176176 RepID=A0A512IRF3_9HYPH|nr:hypothetical protein [Methylobacterium haplocladii]GEP00199.1 hypothetical protein MHA02_25860 [Methylobacterium haplocladii]GJD83745.1 hypothetical protein HPGCJGGD_1616 [Methylobacterium haplocladii]GLS57955.1 hypothetical protein GCM10007887_06110 [Methylobacterium haplocladii]